MFYQQVFKLNAIILTFVLLLSGCGTTDTGQTNLDEEEVAPQDSSEAIVEDEITPTSESTAELAPESTITATPEVTEPGVAQIPRLNFYWPTVFPQDLVIDPTQSTITEDRYELALHDPTGGQWYVTIRGGTLEPPPHSMSEPQTIRGHQGQASTTGAGYAIYWDESDYQYAISSSLGLEEVLALAENLESVSVEIWEDRLAQSMQE